MLVTHDRAVLTGLHISRSMMDRHALRKRYTYLWTGEAVAASLFAALLGWAIYRDGAWHNWIARSYSVGVVILILIQGIVWWRSKLHLLRINQRHLPRAVLRSFQRWRRINWILIGSFPAVVLVAPLITNQPRNSVDILYGALFLGGAVLEQINDYYIQLMYDSAYDWAYLRTHRRLRPGTIAKALDAQR